MNLKHFSDKHLLASTLSLVLKEREILSKILWHLHEIDARKLYSDLQCGSLFEYCVKILKYSEGQASRRIKASRLLKELPEIITKIEAGELSLTQINQAGQFFIDEGITDKKDKNDILDKITDKSTRETDRILAGLKEKGPLKKVSLSLLEETLLKIKKVQALKAHSLKDMDSTLKKMCEEVSILWDPGTIKRRSKVIETQTRYIPKQVKAEIWERDKPKCRNCSSTFALEIGHIHPHARGGKTSVENLQLLCRNCNQRKGLVQFGKRKIKALS